MATAGRCGLSATPTGAGSRSCDGNAGRKMRLMGHKLARRLSKRGTRTWRSRRLGTADNRGISRRGIRCRRGGLVRPNLSHPQDPRDHEHPEESHLTSLIWQGSVSLVR